MSYEISLRKKNTEIKKINQLVSYTFIFMLPNNRFYSRRPAFFFRTKQP